MRKSSAKKIDSFLKILEKKSKKKRQLINIFKQKSTIDRLKPKTAIISTLNNFDKKYLSILILEENLLISTIKEVDIDKIGTNTYYATCKLKKAQVFAISIRDLKYKVEKKARSTTNQTSIVQEIYHNFLNTFSKKNSDTLPPYQKYDHKIILKEE